MRTDILKAYKTVHTWVGISTALLLFVGFYCGAATMFKGALADWAPASVELPAAPSLEQSGTLITQVLEGHPEARKSYTIHFHLSPAQPARMTWTLREPGADHDAPSRLFGASLDSNGDPVVREFREPALAGLLDTLHRRVGLPLPEHWAMPITGAVSLLYFLALMSGLVLLAPTLLSSLFQLRIQASNLRRRWLDAHNLIGLFTLPFHLVIALTAVVFALHDEFYAAQEALLLRKPAVAQGASPGPGQPAQLPRPQANETGRMLSALELQQALASQAPEFTVHRMEFLRGPAGAQVRVFGASPHQMLRGPDFGIGMLDPVTGKLVRSDYFPGRQPAGLALVTSFFSLHFGNYGGLPIRWAYVLLGLSGAFLFYTGNRLWIEARSRRSRDAGSGGLPRSTRVLAALTTGVCTGCIAGVSATIAAAPLLTSGLNAEAWHWAIYYSVQACSLGWAFFRGAGRAQSELLWLSCLCTLAIPGVSLLVQGNPGNATVPQLGVIEWSALVAACMLACLAWMSTGPRRSHAGTSEA